MPPSAVKLIAGKGIATLRIWISFIQIEFNIRQASILSSGKNPQSVIARNTIFPNFAHLI